MRRMVLLIGALVVMLATASPAWRSPPFNPTIEALGPSQHRGGRHDRRARQRRPLFHVERSFNGPSTTPIVIAFKEGEPVGDCSYLVHAGSD